MSRNRSLARGADSRSRLGAIREVRLIPAPKHRTSFAPETIKLNHNKRDSAENPRGARGEMNLGPGPLVLQRQAMPFWIS
jgi:hypothetical protein